MPDIQNASRTNFKVSGTIAIHLRMNETRTRGYYRVISEISSPRTITDDGYWQVLDSIQLAKRKIGLFHSQWMLILMVHEPRSEPGIEKSNACQKVEKRLVLFVRPTRCDPKYITVARQVVHKVVRETPVWIFRKAVGLMQVNPCKNVAKNHACKTVKGMIDVCLGCPSQISIANLGENDVNLHEHQEVGKLDGAPKEIVLIDDEHFCYLSGAKATKSNSHVSSIHSSPLRIFWNNCLNMRASKKRQRNFEGELRRIDSATCLFQGPVPRLYENA